LIKNIFTIGFFSILVLAGLYLYFLFPYTIEHNNKSIETGISKRINDTEASEKYISLKKMERIGNTNTYVAVYSMSNDKYFRSDDFTGFSVLKKGMNGKLKISVSNFGTSNVKSHTFETNKGKYIFFIGHNSEENKTLNVSLATEKYSFSLSEEPYFFVYEKVSKDFDEHQTPEFQFIK